MLLKKSVIWVKRIQILYTPVYPRLEDGKMIVVHVGEYVEGGVATYLNEVITYQCQQPDIEKVILFKSKKDSEVLRIESPKFEEVTYDYNRSLRGIFRILDLYKRIMLFHPDVIHLHSSFAGLFRANFFFRNKHNAKIVYCSHGWSFMIPKGHSVIKSIKNRIYLFVEKFLSLKTDVIINISKNEQMLSKKAGFSSSKLKLIPNTVDLNTHYHSVKNPFLLNTSIKLAFVGRFTEAKGLELLLESFKSLNDDIELMVIGDVADEKNLVNVKQISNSQRVHFMGWIDNEEIDSYLRLADALVIPSKWEGFGLVALEGMRNELAIISSDIPTLSDIVVNNETGVVFKSGNIYSLVNHLNHLDRKKLYEWGQAGKRKLFKDYNPKDMNREILKVYKTQ